MTTYYICAQALTLTKSHKEHIGPLKGVAASVQQYGYDDPQVVFLDDLAKVK